MTCELSWCRFIQEGIAQNVRMDGRGRLDYRPFSLETRLVAQANGSARLVLSDTDVLVGVKAELAEPDAATPAAGRIHVSVEWYAAPRSPVPPSPS